MNYCTVVYACKGVLLRYENEWTIDILKNMDESLIIMHERHQNSV
jgi:hypothetical protein